jgi:hypothetical protein
VNHAFPEKRKKSGGKMLQKWKEKSGEFSQKCQTNTEKTYEKYGKISDVFWKNSNVFQEISYVFSGTSEILSQSEKCDFGRRGVKVVKAKSAKSQGRRARHTRVRKSPYEGGQNRTKATCHFIRQSSEGNTPVMEQNLQHLQSTQSNFSYTKRKNCTFSAIFISLPHLAPI